MELTWKLLNNALGLFQWLRICYDDFNTELGSTLGIDLQTRCLPVGNGRQMCLQFWDTAGDWFHYQVNYQVKLIQLTMMEVLIGQEKYRSLTRQYLRKADGIVLIYDICSEKSFRNVRHWINTVRVISLIHCHYLLLRIFFLLNSSQRSQMKQHHSTDINFSHENRTLFLCRSNSLNSSSS